MSLYIKLSTGYFNHRKTMRLKARLGETAYWIMPKLWTYAADNQPDGDFSGYTPQEMAIILGYNDDASSMLQAMIDVGYMDKDMGLHNWARRNEYHDTYSKRAKKAAKARWSGKTKGKKKTPITKDKTRQDKTRDKHCIKHASSIDRKAKVVMNLWNSTCTSLPKVIQITEKRKRHIAQRLKEIDSLGDWMEVFKKIENSEFLKGGGNTGWQATFDWIIKSPDNLIKVKEGQYDRSGNKQHEPTLPNL